MPGQRAPGGERAVAGRHAGGRDAVRRGARVRRPDLGRRGEGRPARRRGAALRGQLFRAKAVPLQPPDGPLGQEALLARHVVHHHDHTCLNSIIQPSNHPPTFLIPLLSSFTLTELTLIERVFFFQRDAPDLHER